MSMPRTAGLLAEPLAARALAERRPQCQVAAILSIGRPMTLEGIPSARALISRPQLCHGPVGPACRSWSRLAGEIRDLDFSRAAG
jgi:hypothetical protein